MRVKRKPPLKIMPKIQLYKTPKVHPKRTDEFKWTDKANYFFSLSDDNIKKLSESNFSFIWSNLTKKERDQVFGYTKNVFEEDRIMFGSAYRVLIEFYKSPWRRDHSDGYDHETLMLWNKMIDMVKLKLNTDAA